MISPTSASARPLMHGEGTLISVRDFPTFPAQLRGAEARRQLTFSLRTVLFTLAGLNWPAMKKYQNLLDQYRRWRRKRATQSRSPPRPRGHGRDHRLNAVRSRVSTSSYRTRNWAITPSVGIEYHGVRSPHLQHRDAGIPHGLIIVVSITGLIKSRDLSIVVIKETTVQQLEESKLFFSAARAVR